MDYKRKTPLCYAPWITSYEWPDGNITPCCEYKAKVMQTTEEISLEDRFKHPNMQKLKLQLMSSDELPKGCYSCKNLEQVGQGSLRGDFGWKVDAAVENKGYRWNVDEFKLIHMDYRESNLCNFSCQMCGEELSSTLAMIQIKPGTPAWIKGNYGKGGIVKNYQPLEVYLDKIEDTESINFLGGEPLLTDSMWTTLKELRRRKIDQVDIRIVTNGSLLKRHEDDLFEAVKGFRHVEINVSIDCVSDAHNYWRHKDTWDTVKKNLDRLYKWKKDGAILSRGKAAKSVSTRTAIGWPNAYAAREVFDMFRDVDEIDQIWNLVTGQPGLELPNLPQEELDNLVEYWKEYPDVADAFKIKSNPNTFQLAKSKKRLLYQEKYWNNNIIFVDVFPEFKDFYNNIG
jgi:MoaA/NifB/PqqE/SkfB family radical SAM enzyme